jgi:hypothetical protein
VSGSFFHLIAQEDPHHDDAPIRLPAGPAADPPRSG